MQSSLTQERSSGSRLSKDGAAALGLVWGGLCGGIIGVGINLSIGLFYSGASSLVIGVMLMSMLLGALFGHMLATLLGDELALKTASETEPLPARPCEHVIDLTYHFNLQAQKEKIALMNRYLEGVDAQSLSVKMPLPSALSDIRMFERMMQKSNKS